MRPVHPSPIRHWLFAIAAFLLSAAILAALGSFLPELDLALAVGAVAAIALLYALSRTVSCMLVTYYTEAGSLIMERSTIGTDKKLIPIKSVDNLHVRTSAFGRLLSYADVYVDTPGGIGYELVIRDLPSKAADELLAEVSKAAGE